MALLERKDVGDVNNNINNNSSTGTEVPSNVTIYINNLNEKIKIDGNARIPLLLFLVNFKSSSLCLIYVVSML